MKNINKIINNTIHEYLNENLSNEIKQLQRELNYLENVELERARKKRNFDLFDEIVNKIKKIQKILYFLTGDSYGENKQKERNIKPKGLKQLEKI